MAKAGPVPTRTMAAPAIGGPAMDASWSVPWSRALADGSRSASTVRGRNACCAGRYMASAAPNSAPRAASSGRVAASAITSAAMAPTMTPRATCAASIRLRGGRRSARTPNGNSMSARGTPIAIRIVPSANPDWVRSMTSHASAT